MSSDMIELNDLRNDLCYVKKRVVKHMKCFRKGEEVTHHAITCAAPSKTRKQKSCCC